MKPAAHLTKDLLLFSRKQESDKQLVDVNTIVTQVEKLIRRILVRISSAKRVWPVIRGLKPDIKGIFVSGYAPENMQQRDLFDVQTEVLFKPVSPKELLKTIRKVLDAT